MLRRRLRPYLVHGGAIVLFAAITLIYSLPLTLHPASTVAPDPVDPLFHVWSVASTLHQIDTWSDGLWSLFDHNIFYPAPHAGSFGNIALGMLPVLLPLNAAIHDPVALVNALVAVAFVLSAYGAFLLGRFLCGSALGGMVAGLVYAFFPLRIEQIGHLNYLWAGTWLTFAAYCIARAWQRGGVRWWALGGLLGALTAITSLYQLAYLTAPLLCVAVTLGRTWTRERLRGALLAVGIMACLVVPFMIPYAVRAATDPGYGRVLPTDVFSFLRVLAGRPIDSLLLPTVPMQPLQPDHGFFPGIVAVALVAGAWRMRRARRWALLAGACLVMALGPYLLIDGHMLAMPLPYAWAQALVPKFALFHDPTRALTGAALGLAVVAAWGARDVAGRVRAGTRRVGVALTIVGIMALEVWTPIPTVSVPPVPAGERWLATQGTIRVIAELPISNVTLTDWSRQTEIMYDSTVHWKSLVNGSSTTAPRGTAARDATLATYPSPRSLHLLTRLHVDAVVLRLPWLTQAQRTAALASCHLAYRDAQEAVCTGPWR